MAWELWQHRNNIEHNQENAPRAQEMTLAKREVKPLYQGYKGTVPNEDMYLYRNTLEDLPKKSLPYKQEWIKHIKRIGKLQISGGGQPLQ
jgi:hypothetical protein